MTGQPFAAAAMHHWVRWLVAATLVVAITGCESKPRLARLAPAAVVLAFGDSLTQGVGARAEEAYPAQLQRMIGRTVVVRGVPGETSAGGRARLAATLEEIKPALLLLCHGGNDFLRKLDEVALRDNLRAMVKEAHGRNVQVVLVGVPKPALWLSTASVYSEVAKELAVPLEGKSLASVLGDHSLKSDAVHPNAQGYAKLAAALERLLREHGAL